MFKSKILLMLGACLAPALCAFAETAPLYKNPAAPLEDRVTDLLSQLTLEEKAHICHGNFVSGGIPRLGISELLMLDGRQGLRPVEDEKGTRTTSLPCALALSCTWDEAAAHEFSGVLAEEMLAFKRHVLLAPMLNLIRSPLGGRNFENFGEDPYLTGKIGSAYIKGSQDLGVAACSCLLVANDCEHRRHYTNSAMDERTLRELHMLTYELSVRDGNVWSMMTGNNLYNGTHCAHNRYLLQELMKDEIGFDGVMITDWRAAYDTLPAALAGTDMTTGYCSYVFGDDNLLTAVKDGKVPMALLDDKVRRILRLYIRSGVLNPESRAAGGLDTPEHREAARRLGAQGAVLLKNEKQALPLDTGKIRRVLLTGPAADQVIQGGGSGHVPAAVEITPLQGLKSALAGKAEVEHIPFKVNLRPHLDKGAVEWEQDATKPGRRRGRRQQEDDKSSTGALLTAAKSSDAVIFMAAGSQASEGRDLPDMQLPGGQAEAIAALTEANPNVIVVLVNNGALSLDNWGEKVQAIVAVHYAGQATGDAVADVLTGKVNPGGKLSYTFGKRLKDYAVHAVDEWPARLVLEKDPGNPGFKKEERKATLAYTTEYKEGVFAGYRWFDEKQNEPWFPFGHGLSYTTFTLTDLKVSSENSNSSISVSCAVKNTGSREGSEVVQVYVAPQGDASVPRPPQELKGFTKVTLKPGETKTVEIPLRPSALAFYDADKKKWKTEAGTYEIRVGNSSRDKNRLVSKVTVEAEKYHDHY